MPRPTTRKIAGDLAVAIVVFLAASFCVAATPSGANETVASDGPEVSRPDLTRLVAVALQSAGAREAGLGVAITFSSHELRLVDVVDVLAADLLAVSDGSELDGLDLDRDPSTDRLVRLAWLAPFGTWPGCGDGADLARLVFERLEDAPLRPTLGLVSLSPGDRRSPPARLRRFRPSEQGREPTMRAGSMTVRLPGVVQLQSRSWRLRSMTADACSLDIDGNAQIDALTDGILAMRYLFGYTGSSLVQGATASGASRTTGSAVSTFLASTTCPSMLDADGNGTRDALTDGILIARYLFGYTGTALTSGAIGSGASRTGGAAVVGFLDTYRDAESGLVLQAPVLAAPLLSGLPTDLRVGVVYGGSSHLVFSLDQGPSGMTIDTHTGVLTWTPPASMEGQQATVRVSATDGALSADVSFAVRVAAGTPLTTSVSGSTVTVTQSGSLQGLAVTLPSGASVSASQVEIEKVADGQAAAVPTGVTKISDYFRITPVEGNGGLLTFALPTGGRPSGSSPKDVRLFIYTDAIHDFEEGAEPGRVWFPSWYDLDVRSDNKAVIKLGSTGDLCFIGVEDASGSDISTADLVVPETVSQVNGVTISCAAKRLANGNNDANQQVCSLTGDVQLQVTVKHFARINTTPASTRDELLGWLVAARQAFDNMGLKSDPAFEVVIEQMPRRAPNALGFVSRRENRRVLHITKAAKNRNAIQGTAVHEYFHHAQSRTTAAGKTNVLDLGARGQWIYEGTARWFEDEVFDDLNTYLLKETVPIKRILDFGLGMWPDDGFEGSRAYLRFAFWKMIRQQCRGFSLPDVLNFSTNGDPNGMSNLASRIESGAWQCDFAGLGDANRSTLAGALLYYTWATVKDNDMWPLDTNEPNVGFKGVPLMITPARGCASYDSCPAGSRSDSYIMPAGTWAYKIPAVEDLAPGEVAFIGIETASPGMTAYAWLGSNEGNIGPADGTWFEFSDEDTKTQAYAEGEPAPETTLIVVNPDPQKTFKPVKIFAGIQSALAIMPDLDNQIYAPIYGWGCPEEEYTLEAQYQPGFPSNYRITWDFGDDTPDVVVDNDATVEHAWDTIGQFPVTATVTERPSGALVARGAGTASIDYYRGRFRMSQFAGGTSGEFGDPSVYVSWLPFIQNVAADPTNAYFNLGRYSDGGFRVYLTYAPEGGEASTVILGWYQPDDDVDRADCPTIFNLNGNRLTTQFANIIVGLDNGQRRAAICMNFDGTQNGTELTGTFSFWARYYRGGEEPPATEGSGSFSLSGTHVKK